MNNKKSYFYISLLNVLSAIAVVIIHANGSFWTFRNDISWSVNNIIESLFYFAVPIFFMLTGATLLDYTERYGTVTFLKKRFLKAFLPFLFWSVIAMLKVFLSDPNLFLKNEFAVDKIFNGIFNTEYMFIYWFFIPLFCIYLSIPLFANINKEKKLKVLNYIAVVAFFANIFIPFFIKVLNALFGWNILWGFEIPVLSGYLFYTVSGYLLHKCTLEKKMRIIIYAASIFGLFLHIFGTFYLSQRHGEVNKFFKEYTNLPCVLYSLGVFVFIKNISERVKSAKIQSFILRFQKYTFEIYLLHMFLYKPISLVLSKLNVFDDSPAFVLLMTVFAIPACILITFILRKIPLIRYVVPQ
ncbi:MAG: acyltransferase [Clostridiales bacterium]|nr:acyltransferase [Clostridiales bacterium]